MQPAQLAPAPEGRGGRASPSPSRLNPLAGSFEPSWATNTTLQPAASTSAASPLSPSSSADDTTLIGARSPAVAPLAVPARPPSTASEDLHDPWTFQRAHLLSPHTRTNTRHTSDDGSASSFDWDLPTRRAFRRAHLAIQFPISFIALSGLFAFLVLWKHSVRWVEFALGATAWLASEPIKDLVFQALTFPRRDKDGRPIKGTGAGVPTVVHAVVQEFLRLGAILLTVALLPEPETSSSSYAQTPHRPSGPPPRRRPLPPLDTLFVSAMWLALGWACAEVLSGSLDFMKRMKLYDDVLSDNEYDDNDEEADLDSPELTESEPLFPSRGVPVPYGATVLAQRPLAMLEPATDKLSRSVTMLEPELPLPVTAEEEEEEDAAELDILIRRVERLEVEAQLGVPLYEIPVMVVVVWRIDAILLSIVLTLFLSLPCRTTSPSLVAFPLWPTFAASAIVHVLLSLLWVLRIPSVGLPSLSYATLVVVTALLFGVLGAWGALE